MPQITPETLYFFLCILASICAIYVSIIAELIFIKRRGNKQQPTAYKNNPKEYVKDTHIIALLSIITSPFLLVALHEAGTDYNIFLSLYLGFSLPDVLTRGAFRKFMMTQPGTHK